MANALTGDFDVVAEFALGAANRVLAAMQRSQRFPHSLALTVDDYPLPGSIVVRPSVQGNVEMLNDPVADHTRIGTSVAFPAQLSASNSLHTLSNRVVNPDLGELAPGTVVPSRLKGRAQLQLAVPRIEVPDGSGNRIRVRIEMRSRYFPAPGTTWLAEFVRGELALTAAVKQSQSATENVVDVDVKSDEVEINFTPAWSSQPLSPEGGPEAHSTRWSSCLGTSAEVSPAGC